MPLDAHPQMLSAINSTNPMPANSTASATESYSSQCRESESITSIPVPQVGYPSENFADLPHTCFRRISPQRFWFRGLWQKPGQRFAVCGGNPAWQILQKHDEDDGAVWSQEGTRPFSARVQRTSLVVLVADSRMNEKRDALRFDPLFRAPGRHPAATLAAAKGRLVRCTVPGSTPNCLAMTPHPGPLGPRGFVFPVATTSLERSKERNR